MNAKLGFLDDILKGGIFSNDEMQEEIQKAHEQAAKVYMDILQKHAEKSAKELIRKVANAMLAMIDEAPATRGKEKLPKKRRNLLASAYEKIGSMHRQIRMSELDNDERRFFAPIKDNELITKTFKLRTCKCLSEANFLLSQYLRDISRKNGYATVHWRGSNTAYDLRAIKALCSGYRNKTLDATVMASLRYFFE